MDNNAEARSELVLRIESPDQPGIVAQVSRALSENGCDIRDAIVFGDPDTGRFFVRMHLWSEERSAHELEQALNPVAKSLNLEYRLIDLEKRPRVLIAVSKFDHCLNDLLHKWRIGTLPIEVVGIVSNHEDLKPVADWHEVGFTHLPITPETKPEQEAQFSKLIHDCEADLVVLARYMQVLSDDLSKKLAGRCINIHHSFLPSFKGARPYHQAHQRGVKLIGATAHFVTVDLDEGPIIEQDVRRVSHTTTAREMVEIGREVEASVLSRAVKWYAEHRVFLSGARTIVLR